MAAAGLTPERRRLARETRPARVLVQFTRRNPALGRGPVLRGRCVDISESGLQLMSDMPVPARCLLDLWIDIGDECKYLLRGEARWRSMIGDGRAYLTGIALDTCAEDFAAWQDRFRRSAQVILFPWRRTP